MTESQIATKNVKKRIRTLQNDGASTKQIAEALNQEGVITARGNKWNANAVQYHIRTGARIRNRKPKGATSVKGDPKAPGHAASTLKAILGILSVKQVSADDRIAMAMILAEAHK